MSLASTMVLSRLLLDRGEIRSRHGRAMIGITLVDDLAFVVMTILLPALTAISASSLFLRLPHSHRTRVSIHRCFAAIPPLYAPALVS